MGAGRGRAGPGQGDDPRRRPGNPGRPAGRGGGGRAARDQPFDPRSAARPRRFGRHQLGRPARAPRWSSACRARAARRWRPHRGRARVRDVGQDAPIRVMVVDDHPMWRDAVARDLTEAGYDVVATAADGAQALRVAGAARPDVVVLDLQLPDMSGVEVTRGLRAAHPAARVLVLSASGEQQDVLDAVKAGAAGYLLKSAARPEFLDAVRRTAAATRCSPPGSPRSCSASSGGWPPGPRRRHGRPAADRTGDRDPPHGAPRAVLQADRQPACRCPTAPCRTTCRTRWASSSCTTGSSWSGTPSSTAWRTSPGGSRLAALKLLMSSLGIPVEYERRCGASRRPGG